MVSDENTQKAILYDLRQDNTLVGKCKVAPDFRFIQVNDVLCGYLECTKAQLLSTTFPAITLPDDSPIDVLNAQAVKDGAIDGYQFPKRYRPLWLDRIVYVIIDVQGVRNTKGEFLYFDVEVLEISKQEYLRLRKSVLRQKSASLKTLLNWTGGLSVTQIKGLAVWIALIVISASIGVRIKLDMVKEWLADYLH